MVDRCSHLGFQINFDKSELVPTQVFDFVWMHIDLCLGMVFVTEKNLAKVVAAV